MAVHLYGVIPAGSDLPELTGRAGAPVRPVVAGDLRAVVSDIDADATAGRDDLLAHAHTLEALVALTTVLPAQFGVVMPDDEHVRTELLEAGRDELTQLLRDFDGLLQVTVQARYQEEAALRELLRRDPELVELREVARGGGHAQQVRLGEAVAAGLDRLTRSEGDRLLGVLAPYARAIADNDTRGAHDVLNAALLIERTRQRDLDAAVAELARSVAPAMSIRYVGPQPPYSFLEPMQRGEIAWA
jgi:hypothetical protein